MLFRNFLVFFLFAAAAFPASLPVEHRLRLYETHTGEHLDVVYKLGDHYVPEGLAELDHFLRDHRTGDVHHYAPRLFDLLSDLTAAVGRAGAEIDVLCGYRSPWSNELLRRTTTGVAKNSLHMQAEAIDIRLPGTKISVFHKAALALHRGGVGYYPASNFIHVDVGRVRRW
ncbi:MAG: YcbK family protein [Bryobacteraceae bacterium]